VKKGKAKKVAGSNIAQEMKAGRPAKQDSVKAKPKKKA